MLEGSFLMGLIGGRIVGLLGGSLISLPAFGHHEWISSPLAALVGLVAGMIREMIPEKEDVWHFGPFLFLNIPQWLVRLIRYGKGNWAMLPLLACAACELVQIEVTGPWCYCLRPDVVIVHALFHRLKELASEENDDSGAQADFFRRVHRRVYYLC